MKAVYIEAPGPPEAIRYGDLPTPEPKNGEVRIRVGAGSVNPVDTYIRAGTVAMNIPLPFVLGCDVAGTVEAIGENVKRFKVGDRVWGSNQGLLGRQGTFAEYACVHEDWLYPTPSKVPDAEAAANALVGITAWLGLDWRAKLEQGETLFVNGGTGGVGAMVVQMAKALGAKVITTVGSAEKAKLAGQLGADLAINYRSEDVAARIKESCGGVDVWFETQPPSDLESTFGCMTPGGRVIVMAGRAAKPVWPNGAFYTRNLQLFGFAMFNVTAEIQRQAAGDMNRWMSEGKLKALIGATFPQSRAAEAHRLQEENTLGKKGTLTGKIVVVPG